MALLSKPKTKLYGFVETSEAKIGERQSLEQNVVLVVEFIYS